MNDIIEPRRVYGGRAKALGPVRVAAINRLPEYEIKLDGALPGTLLPLSLKGEGGAPAPGEGFSNSTNYPSSTASQHLLPSGRRKIHLEIGCGTGEHTAELATQNPDDLFLAAEPFRAGVANLLRLITQQNIPNIRIYPNDGLALLRALALASIDHAYLLFPDPWPKKRHHDRRFLQTETLVEFARVVKPNGSLLLASDDLGMQAWMHTHMAQQTEFTRQDHAPHQPITRYAAKGIAAGRQPEYLYFIKK